MNEQAIIDSYNTFVSQGYTKSIDEFKKLIASNPQALQDSYTAFQGVGYKKSIDEYKTLMGVSATPAPAQQPQVAPAPEEVAQPTVEKKSPSVTTALPAEGSSSASPLPPTKTKEDEEEDYFKGAFGNVLRSIDKFSPIGIGDFVDDMARSVASGYRQGTQAQEADRLLLKGTKATPEQIQKFIDANKNAQAIGPSAEMQNYQKIYEKEGKGFWGVIKGLVNNPSIIPEVISSSLVGMATNTDALKAGAAAIGTGLTYGAVTGAAATPEFLGAGAIPGAVAGASAAVPYAFGLASSVVEMGSTFGELLTDELKGKEMTKENVKAILENPEKLNSIRNKAISRGVIIGTVDALTGKLASGVGAKIMTKSAAKSATGAVTRGAVTRAAAAGSAVEALGGSLGEATARAATGQDLDVSEIALEGLSELPGGIRSTIQAKFAKPSYKINGEKVSAEQVDEIINTMDPADLAKTNIEIKNDYEGREFKMRDKIVTHGIKEEVRQANPDLNEPSLNAITELEKELKTLEGNKTQTGKDKASVIREKIKNIQENQLQEEVKTETVQAEAPEVTAKRTDRIAELETILAEPDNGKNTVTIDDKLVAKDELQTELETLKKEQDAVQKQSTNESVLLTEQPQLGLQEVVEGNEKPQETTVKTEGTQEVDPLKDVESTAYAISKGVYDDVFKDEDVDKIYETIPRDYVDMEDSHNNIVAEAYHKAKTDGSNPELVKAVEDLLVKPTEQKTEVTPTVTPEVVSEVTFEGKRGQADSITFDGKTIKQGEEIDLNDVNISQDDTMPDLRSGKYKVRMLSVDANGKTATLTLTDGNEVITTTVKDLRNSESKKASSAPEGKPKTALQEATEKRKAAKALLKSLKQGMGISPEAKLEALVKYHKALVNEAKEFIKEKKGDLEAWAKSIGESVTKITQTAWDEATGKIKKPIEKGEELDYTFEDTFGEDIDQLPDYDKAMEDVQLEVDKAYNSIEYLKSVVESAKKIYEKNKSEKSKKRLNDAEAELKQYEEEYFEKSKKIAIADLKKTELYKTANGIQQELLIRDVLSRFGERQKKAPSAEKVLGKKPQEKTVLMTEKEALIKQLKDLSRGGKDATKTIKEVTASIAKTLKDLQTKGELTVDQVNRILGKLAKVNMLKEESVNKFVDGITEVFEEAQEAKTAKDKKAIIKKMLELVNKKAKTLITASGKRKSKGLDPDGQLFFQSIREIVTAASDNDTAKIDKIANELQNRQSEIDDAVQKEMTGKPLTLEETILLNQAMAHDMFGDMVNMSVDEIETLYDSLKDVRAESIKRLKDKRIESAAKKASMVLEANDNIQEGFGILFNADGTPKSEKDLNQDKKDIYESFKKLKIWEGVKKYLERYDFNSKNFITNFFRNKAANIGTICNILDKKGDLFKRNVYDKLNDMNEKKRIGIEAQTKLLDTLANKIFGTKKDGYQKLKYKLAGKGTKKININGRDYTFNYGQLLRMYALSLNRIQRGKLEKMGFDSAKLQEIKTALGPEFTKFADDVVEYLSTDYFGTVNDVYRKVNDVNLNQIENYFPTKTVSKEANAELLKKGDFNGIFNAETSPAFKERLDKTSPIDLEPSFTDVLDNHVETMEMYKSHAEDVKEMNTFFSIPSVKTLLDQTGLGPVLKFNVNNSISPNANAPIRAKGMDKIINNFTPFALAFKGMQFVKQATSIGAAYGDYSFRKNKQMFLADLPFFIADVAKIMATPRANIKKFKNISATFKERYDSGLAGNVASIESGNRTFLSSAQKNTRLGKFKRAFRSAAGFATFAGDIVSTFGYMANYNRDIKNGMNPEKALQKFNDYNATLQTKRPSEKSPIQHNQDFLSRTVTMFGSSGLLMMNTVSQSTKNILRSVSKGESPKTRDIRKLVFAVGVGNALFIAASNAFKLMSGDDEDKDKAKEDIFEALIGLNLLTQLPVIGEAVEYAKSKIKGERYYDSSSTNPMLQVGKKIAKIYDEEQGNIIYALRPIAEMEAGFQFEPFIALGNSVVEGEVDEDDMYDMLGVAKSYRPTGEEEQAVKAEKNVKEEDTTSKELESLQELINTETNADIINEAVKRIEYLRMTDDEKKQYKKERKEEVQADKTEIDALLGEYDSKDEMRRYDKALYEKTFGEGSDYYNRHEAKSKMEAKVRELEQKAEDKERGFYEPVKEKKSKRNSDGSYKRTYKRTYKRSYSRGD